MNPDGTYRLRLDCDNLRLRSSATGKTMTILDHSMSSGKSIDCRGIMVHPKIEVSVKATLTRQQEYSLAQKLAYEKARKNCFILI